MTEKINEQKQLSHVDDVLLNFKLYGRYHFTFITMVYLANTFSNIYCTNYIFVVERVNYRCKDERYINQSCTAISNVSEGCTEWVYDDPHSFVAEFNLACQDWKRTLVGTIHSIGYMIGLLIVGPLSDRIGRKKTIVITGLLGAVFGLARGFTTSFWLYIVLEFLEASIGDLFSPLFIMTMEIVAYDKRLLCKMFCSFGSSTGYLMLPSIAYFFPYWRHLLIVLYAPSLLILSYHFLLDESPRWLLANGRKEEAIVILEKMAKQNKTVIDKSVLDNLSYEESKSTNLKELLKETFKSKELKQRFIICLVWWTTCTFVSYGMRINVVFLPGNKYINYGLISLIDLLSKIIITKTLLRFRRRIPLICCFIMASIFIVIQSLVPNNLQWVSVALFMAGEAMTVCYFSITYIYTSELFPTYTRNSMHALCSSLGRIGSIIAPQTPLLTAYWTGFPSLVFGCASLCAGLVTLMAPDTADEALPDTVTQAEAMGHKDVTSKTIEDRSEKYFTKC